MSTVVNVHEAKTHLSRLLEQVALGNEIIIAKSGKPVARLSPVAKPARKLPYGLLKGEFKVLPGFDDPLPDSFLEGFEGR